MHSVQSTLKMNEYINRNVFYLFSGQVRVHICYEFEKSDLVLNVEMQSISPTPVSTFKSV